MSKRQPEGAVQAAPQEGARGAAGPTLTGKVVLITGASSGIGRAMALACAEAGADLALTYRANQRAADDTAERVREHGRRAELLSVDVADARAVETLAAHVRDAFGRVDVWVNNAGADILTGKRRALPGSKNSTACSPWISAERCSPRGRRSPSCGGSPQ